jgi:hypothetical protein
MASSEHLKILKRGIKAWNKWRENYPNIEPNLRKANLSGLDLRTINLNGANLIEANLEKANLVDALLNQAILIGANLHYANLARTELRQADFSYTEIMDANIAIADLTGVDFQLAILHRTNFHLANLTDVNLTEANLGRATVYRSNLRGTNFTKARLAETVFADCDLSVAKGLEKAKFISPSSIDINTVYRSGGNIPERFLKGIGVPEDFITYAKSITKQAVEFYSCFISYSSRDQKFAERLYSDLQNQGIRCWFAPEDLKIGERIRLEIDESIRKYDKLLLILSKNSVQSEWVEKEVETALDQERKQKRTILFPIRLDDTVMKIDSGWPSDIKRTRHIGDFKKWKDYDSYQQAFERLLRDLELQ